jgi:hypothetical protein
MPISSLDNKIRIKTPTKKIEATGNSLGGFAKLVAPAPHLLL